MKSFESQYLTTFATDHKVFNGFNKYRIQIDLNGTIAKHSAFRKNRNKIKANKEETFFSFDIF